MQLLHKILKTNSVCVLAYWLAKAHFNEIHLRIYVRDIYALLLNRPKIN